MNLFQTGLFDLASGASSTFKIECDALVEKDWLTLALIIAKRVPTFELAVGVPDGGVPLANALMSYAVQDAKRILVVDDVWTTGASMNSFIEEQYPRSEHKKEIYGAVVFARNNPPSWIYPLFIMT